MVLTLEKASLRKHKISVFKMSVPRLAAGLSGEGLKSKRTLNEKHTENIYIPRAKLFAKLRIHRRAFPSAPVQRDNYRTFDVQHYSVYLPDSVLITTCCTIVRNRTRERHDSMHYPMRLRDVNSTIRNFYVLDAKCKKACNFIPRYV